MKDHRQRKRALAVGQPQFREPARMIGIAKDRIGLAWGDVNVPRAKQVKATLLALNIFNHACATQAVPEPAEGGSSGN